MTCTFIHPATNRQPRFYGLQAIAKIRPEFCGQFLRSIGNRLPAYQVGSCPNSEESYVFCPYCFYFPAQMCKISIMSKMCISGFDRESGLCYLEYNDIISMKQQFYG